MKSLSKKLCFVFADYLISVLSVFVILVCTENIKTFTAKPFVLEFSFAIYPSIVLLIAYIFNVYSIMWEFADLLDYARLFVVSFVASALLYTVHSAVLENDKPFDLESCVLIAFVTFSLMTILRGVIYKRQKIISVSDNNLRGNVMVIGGGSAGSMLVSDIKKNSKHSGCSVECIIDDDPHKKGLLISGVKVVGGSDQIVSAAKKYNIDIIVFAIPTCPSSRKSAILNFCQKTGCKVRVLPSYFQIIENPQEVNSASLREVQIEDLLGRDPIDIKVNKVLDYVNGHTVLVTGGGGSIGSELCRQIASHTPERLIIFDIYENNAYDIQNELLRSYPELNLTTLIGSVRDINRLNAVFEKYKPQFVFHAAAHKHVPLMEDSPNESIKNNVFGTFNVASCADKYGVKRFVLISTDKAVNPTNIMGASKRICEMVVQYFNSRSSTEFVAVRFGNVLGSNGSVIPLFKKQIEKGGPVTVTDPNIIRYFMTIPEAVSLVLQAGATAKGGEIFVLDMGEPVKILDLAENLIRLSGLEPYIDIKIEFTGLRPGEKMYEEKLLAEEGLKRTENRLIHIGKPISFDENNFINILDELKSKMADDNSDIRAIVKSIVPTYSYNE